MHAKKVLIPFLLLLALVPLCACTATVPTPGVPLPQLVIGSDNYPPYNYTDENGFPAGVDVALAREPAAALATSPSFGSLIGTKRMNFCKMVRLIACGAAFP